MNQNIRDESALLDSIRLSLISGVGPLTRKALIERFGSATETLSAAPSDLQQVAGVGPTLAARIATARETVDAEQELALCKEHHVQIVSPDSQDYPKPLQEIHDPPGQLFVHGELLPQDTLAVAIVGTRHATSYGLQQAEKLAASLARSGFTIVSGRQPAAARLLFWEVGFWKSILPNISILPKRSAAQGR